MAGTQTKAVMQDADLIVFSLDYDGCGDLLFDDWFDEFDSAELVRARAQQQFLTQWLRTRARAGRTVLMCGSLRQDNQYDSVMAHANNNGSAFRNLASHEAWQFNRFLLPDGESASGPTMSCDGASGFECGAIVSSQMRRVALDFPRRPVDRFLLYRRSLFSSHRHWLALRGRRSAAGADSLILPRPILLAPVVYDDARESPLRVYAHLREV